MCGVFRDNGPKVNVPKVFRETPFGSLNLPENIQLSEKWALLPEQMLDHVVLNMERWCQGNTAVKECHSIAKGHLFMLSSSFTYKILSLFETHGFRKFLAELREINRLLLKFWYHCMWFKLIKLLPISVFRNLALRYKHNHFIMKPIPNSNEK